jgi:hypothetical protein
MSAASKAASKACQQQVTQQVKRFALGVSEAVIICYDLL